MLKHEIKLLKHYLRNVFNSFDGNVHEILPPEINNFSLDFNIIFKNNNLINNEHIPNPMQCLHQVVMCKRRNNLWFTSICVCMCQSSLGNLNSAWRVNACVCKCACAWIHIDDARKKHSQKMFRSLYFKDEELKLKCLIKTCILISNKGILEFSFIQADSSSNFIRCHICTCYFHRQEADTKHSKRVALRQNTQKRRS